MDLRLRPIGIVRSTLRSKSEAPRQGREGGVEALVEIEPEFSAALEGVEAGDDVLLFTWLHEARRDTLRVHPRDDPSRALAGVFATRSPDRPNPIGLHPVRVLSRDGPNLRVAPLDAIDGTPVLDIKPILGGHTMCGMSEPTVG